MWSAEFDNRSLDNLRTDAYDRRVQSDRPVSLSRPTSRLIGPVQFLDACSAFPVIGAPVAVADDDDDYYYDAHDTWQISAKSARRRERKAARALAAIPPAPVPFLSRACAAVAGTVQSAAHAVLNPSMPPSPLDFSPLPQDFSAVPHVSDRRPPPKPSRHAALPAFLMCAALASAANLPVASANPSMSAFPPLSAMHTPPPYLYSGQELRKRAMPPAMSKPGDLLRVPPVGWRWASVAVDSGCSIHIINDPSVFARLQSTTARVRIADGRSTAMVGEGPVALQTYNSSNQPFSLLLSRALHKPSMKNLLSVSQLMRDGCDITFSHTGAAYITTPSQGQIRLRLDGGLLYLDYLVPQNKNVSPLRPLPTAVFEAASAICLFVCLFVSRCSSSP